MDANFIIAQIFGILGIIASVCSMQFKKRKTIFIVLLLLNLFSALNFIFLGTFASAYICLFAILEMLINGAFEKKNKPVPKYVVGIYIIINIALGTLSFSGPLDIIPITCALIFCATILTKEEQDIRKLTLLNQILWLIFDLSVGAYMFAISNVLTIISTSIALYRFHKKPAKKQITKSSAKKTTKRKVVKR
ncbi:YgjV family protein [Candidatus Saccharibacteria bacterium]|nr:YgjV family protein [Candidatus Saccharibacteria bacterium]